MGKEVNEVMEGYKETEIGVLPEDWEIVRIGEVSERMKAGGTPKRSEPSYWGGSIPFVLIEDMTSCGLYLTATKETITEEGLANSSAWLVPPNSLLLSMYATIGETAINTIPVATNQAILAIIPKSKLDVRFGAYSLKYHADRLLMCNVQSTQRNVNKGIVEQFPIPLPPLPEQRKIAYVLSTIQRVIELQDKVIAATRELKKSLMRHLFTYGSVPVDQIDRVPLKKTEIGMVPEHWEVVRLGELISSGPQNGIYKPQYLYGEGTPIVRIDDFANEGQILTKVPNRVRLSLNEIEKYCLKLNDILINRVNSISHLGKVALIGELKEETVFESNMMRFSVDCNYVLPEYVFLILSSWIGQEQLKGKAKRAVAQSSINQTDVKTTVIPVPPLDEQKDIVRCIFLVEKQVTIQERRKMYLQSLFQTVLHLLMTCKVRVKDLEVKEDALRR